MAEQSDKNSLLSEEGSRIALLLTGATLLVVFVAGVIAYQSRGDSDSIDTEAGENEQAFTPVGTANSELSGPDQGSLQVVPGKAESDRSVTPSLLTNVSENLRPTTTLLPLQTTSTSGSVTTENQNNTPSSQRPTTPSPATVVSDPGPGDGNVDAFTPVNGKAVIWGDNFDELDTDFWEVETLSTYGDGNDELQCYMPQNTRVSNGQLILTAKKETVDCGGETRQYTSGMVRDRNTNFQPGQGIEFRVKLTPADSANQKGLWPAVWSSSWSQGGWPLGGELDYFEMMTANNLDRPVFSIHFQEPGGRKGIANREYQLDRPFTDEWHTIRFEYGRGGNLRWYIDGNLANEVTSANTSQGWPSPFDERIRDIKINLALGGTPGRAANCPRPFTPPCPLDDRALAGSGATFAVDYIKIYPL